MFARLSVALLVVVAALAALPAADGPQDNIPEKVRPIPPKGNALPDDVRDEIKKGLAELQQLIEDIGKHDLLPDVLIYEKAVRWALDYDEVYDGKAGKDGKAPPPGGNVKKVLAAGLERAKAMKDGKTPWTTQAGPVLRGYRSKIDGSVQPYWIVLPKEYDFAAKNTYRLDFWWHGRGETLSEANFMSSAPVASGIIPTPWTIVLHPYGRYCNANKFAGEVDTFECLDHAKKHYRIYDKQIVARGFSMGGAACWQFAVHYPSFWAAAAPGAGFAETPEFLDVFQKEKLEPTWYEKKLWHLYNATDYAQNLFNLPTVAYSGENDSQKQAADVMAHELKKEGIQLTHIIGPKTGHTYHPDAKEEVNRRIDAIVGRNRDFYWPADLKFTTFTLRYNQCHWLTINSLTWHWARSWVDADVKFTEFLIKTRNVTGLTISLPAGTFLPTLRMRPQVTIDDQQQDVGPLTTDGSLVLHYRKFDGKWKQADSPHPDGLAKIHGLQGPIDDAFMDAFVNVAPTGRPMNSKTAEWADKEMKHAADQWRKQFRGDAPMKKDTEVTADDIKNSNLVLWGDPMSNAVLAKIADKLPIKWTDKGVTVGDQTYEPGTHVPVLIYPNPLNPTRYVVLNSGFTFREYDQLNNARQVPKLPDYAVIDITTPPNARFPGKVVRAGFFGEKWELLPDDGK